MACITEDEEPSLASLLLHYLKEFCEDEFKEFKWHLSQKVLKDFQPIPKGQVTKLDKMDVVDVMINAFCKEGALKIFLKILKKMKQNDLAQRLEGDLQKRNLYPTLSSEGPEPTEMAPSSTAANRGFYEPPPSSSTAPTRGFNESSLYLSEPPLSRESFSHREPPVARGLGQAPITPRSQLLQYSRINGQLPPPPDCWKEHMGTGRVNSTGVNPARQAMPMLPCMACQSYDSQLAMSMMMERLNLDGQALLIYKKYLNM